MTKKVKAFVYDGSLKPPPADAAERIEALAADGWSRVGIARQLGVGNDLFMAWRDADPALEEALQAGRDKEHQALYNVLYRRAVEGDCRTSAIFLLKARHGYRDHGETGDVGNRVTINFAMPGALSLDQFGSG